MVIVLPNRNSLVYLWLYCGSNNTMITKEMVEYWLEENYHKWIANVIVDICNEPHDINHLKKQIKYEWEVRNK